MTEFSYTVTIDGENYSERQLARYEYERTLHVLHELLGLGVELKWNGRALSHLDLNWLAPAEAKRLSEQTREKLGEKETLKVYREVLADTDRRWKEYNRDYDPSQVHLGTTEIAVTGVSFQEAMATVSGTVDAKAALEVNPEHYIVVGDIAAGQRGMETFGMFGEPAFVHGVADKEIPRGLPIKKDPAYPLTLCGEMLLKSDDTSIHVGACHQVQPREDGFAMKSTFFCPGRAPKAIADGHKIHFALEIINGAKFAAKQH